MTGAELSSYISTKVDKAYSDYWVPVKRNAIILEAMIKGEEDKYADLTNQKITDQLFTLIRTSVAYTPVNNEVDLITGITDYLHLLAMQPRFSVPLNVNITSASNTTPIVITINKLTNLRDGDMVDIAGVSGNTAANGTRFVKQIYADYVYNKFAFALYSDAKLTQGISGNGVYVSGGSMSRIFLNWVKKKNSYRKYSIFGIPTVNDPYYEIADGKLKILPLTETCTSISIDYLKKPTVIVDVNDAVIDLEITYPLSYLYFLADETAKLMAIYSRDGELYNAEEVEIAQQK